MRRPPHREQIVDVDEESSSQAQRKSGAADDVDESAPVVLGRGDAKGAHEINHRGARVDDAVDGPLGFPDASHLESPAAALYLHAAVGLAYVNFGAPQKTLRCMPWAVLYVSATA